MRRVFEKDVLECQRCGGRRKIIAAIVQHDVIVDILGCLGLPTRPPSPAPARGPPQAEFEFVDPEWNDPAC